MIRLDKLPLLLFFYSRPIQHCAIQIMMSITAGVFMITCLFSGALCSYSYVEEAINIVSEIMGETRFQQLVFLSFFNGFVYVRFAPIQKNFNIFKISLCAQRPAMLCKVILP